MKYLLDTNAWIKVLRTEASPVTARLAEHHIEQIGMSSIVLHELYFGAYRSRYIAQNLDDIDQLLFPVVEYGRHDALAAARVRAELMTAGNTIGHYDVLIAGQALARGLTMVTHNVGEFARVPGLRVEDWTR